MIEEFDEKFLEKTFDSYQGWKISDLDELKSFLTHVYNTALQDAKKALPENPAYIGGANLYEPKDQWEERFDKEIK